MQTPCFTSLYPYSSSELSTSLTNIKLVPTLKIPGGLELFDTGRPFIPIVGLTNDGTSLIYDTIANNKTYKSFCIDWFNAAYLASQNAIIYDNIPNADYIQGAFSQYLYKKLISNPANLTRFNYIAELVYNFWNNADAAWTNAQYFSEINNFIEQLKSQASKDFYIPNGDYLIAAADALNVLNAAWLVTNPNFNGWLGIEFYV